MPLTPHQLKQIEVIDAIEEHVAGNSINFSTVSPTNDFEADPRLALTSVHVPSDILVQQLLEIQKSFKKLEPNAYYYSPESFHATIKGIRIINDPPQFDDKDIERAQKVFACVVPKFPSFNAYYYRLLLFPNSLALIGTTDPVLDKLILKLDKELTAAGMPDDKIYLNSRYFFSNITLARFNKPATRVFKQKAAEISKSLVFEPYVIDSVTLTTCNAVFKNRKDIDTWKLS